MPSYASLSSQIEGIKSEITASLAASTYTAQDLVYVAKAVETLGNLLGVNDIVAATADAQVQLNNYLATILNGTAPATITKLYVGSGATTMETYDSLTYPVVIASANQNNYTQIAFQNQSSGTSASTDFIAYTDNGTDDSGYIDVGITSSAFSDPGFTSTTSNDGYIFVEAPRVITATISGKALSNNVATITTSTAHGFRVGMPVTIAGVDSTFNGSYTIATIPTTLTFTYAKTASAVGQTAASGTATAGKQGSGNLVLATGGKGSSNKIIFAAGGLQSNNTQMVITPDTKVAIAIATQSTSTTTGALTVNGGVGIVGNLNVGGSVTITGTISFSGGGTTVQTANIAVVNPAIFVADGNSANLLDFTFAGSYTSSGTKYAVLSKKASDGIWYFGSGLTNKPDTTVNYTGVTYDTIQVGGVKNSGTLVQTGDVTINTNKFVVTASSGAVQTAGTITTPEVLITGAVTQETDATTVSYVYSAISGTWATKNAAYTLVNRDAIFADTSAGTFTLTLPASPAANNRVRIADLAGTWGSVPLTLGRNGNKIMGLSEDYSLNVKNASVDLIYSGSTYGWRFV